MPVLYNFQYYKRLRQQLRNSATEAELRLWHYLRKKQFNGLKFRRQHGIGRYIIDFYCPSYRLAIEIDGGQHYEHRRQRYDLYRQRFLESLDITVIRFTNSEVMNELDNVLERLHQVVTGIAL
ncbi:MAG: endonuclease domain-containing protein [Candidatus Kerfeldbacteria bacterium]|nr:endonuclease domain-containing protein [Candidatus Kerfeldbacteria bacterium]